MKLTKITKAQLLRMRDHEAVLTALRGPDAYGSVTNVIDITTIKWRTACVIRACISDWGYGDVAEPSTAFRIEPGDIKLVGQHYLKHQIAAAVVLGLVPASSFHPHDVYSPQQLKGRSANTRIPTEGEIAVRQGDY